MESECPSQKPDMRSKQVDFNTFMYYYNPVLS
jgi:hypothetical protein